MKKIIIILLLFVFNTSVAKADIASGFEDNTNFTNKEDQFNLLPGGILYGISFIGVNEASWHGSPTPNSESQMLIPTIGGIWPTTNGSVSLSIQKPLFVKGKSIMVGIENNSDDSLNNKTNVFEIVFGYRRNLGYMIPWL